MPAVSGDARSIVGSHRVSRHRTAAKVKAIARSEVACVWPDDH